MPRRKTDTTTAGQATAAKDKASTPKKDTITVSVEVTPAEYNVLQELAVSYGFPNDKAGVITVLRDVLDTHVF